MYPLLVLVVAFALLELFEIKPSEEKHESGNYRQEDKDIGPVSI